MPGLQCNGADLSEWEAVVDAKLNPEHEVTIAKPYYMGVYKVTQGVFVYIAIDGERRPRPLPVED